VIGVRLSGLVPLSTGFRNYGDEFPLLDRRGGCAIKKSRGATKAAQTGWLFQKIS
jgi:hypothetical protein